ncbi:long-chain-fatty-acid--[acyl-carrier-protein] ligase AEE15, chloroplastic-like isoform X2 [Camellia sinensis]|uniref:long-chain-fatty-acid--[acyl-carrier-protein] ligase AEE15, chloroplastic-like isoform X2 n=1 Tax=Camellia sinensis TaxID=4442 RepID=UPI001035D71A|nr:long-chain-fatty-acid--[acyl-carrier-protein] ligase AEE15, chloroplastic-like isoform X2 [Camellia sinensis]
MTIVLTSNLVFNSLDRRLTFQFLFSHSRSINSNLLYQNFRPTRIPSTPLFRVHCESTTEEMKIRKCSPFLESVFLSGDGVLVSSEWNTVPDIWRSSAERFGDRVALVDPYHDPPLTMTYKQIEQEILNFSEGLRVIGLKPGEKLALFADNSCRWLIADQGIMATGAINVVRGSRSSVEELLQIYNHSESVALAVDNPEFFNRIAETFCSQAATKFVILLWGEKSSLISKVLEGLSVYNYKEIIDLGCESRMRLLESHDARQHYTYEAINSDDVATLVYTSGTTGNPKGVMLTHKNLLHQINNLWDIVPAEPVDRFLSMLPPWHAYERACEYFIFTHGVEQVYTTVKYLKEDLRHYQPNYLISVPLVYETLYKYVISSGIIEIISRGKYLTKSQKQPKYLVSALDWLWARIISLILWPVHILAKKLVYNKIHSAIGISKAGISGGGRLPSHVDKFFEAIGIKVQNGYGLTESSPVVAARHRACNVLGSIGRPLQHTEIRVVDSETGEVLPPGSKGIVEVKGPQVMKGYYKNESTTKQVLDEGGWLNTGDIGWIAPHHSIGRSRLCGGMVVLEGRAKDTIVLSTGENVEPSELEEASLKSSLIQQIVVIGQDQRRLGAIIVPNKEEILVTAKKLLIVGADASELSEEKMTSLLYEELRKWTSGCSFQIGPILLVDEPFTIDNGLMTPTMKIRRDKVAAQYKEQIDNLYK